MNDKAYWSASLPPGSPAWQACVGTRGSLTEHLMATGRQFSVDVLAQGAADVHDDVLDLLQVNAKQTVYARHVRLLLDGVPVVAARSARSEPSTGIRIFLNMLTPDGASGGNHYAAQYAWRPRAMA